MVSPDNSFWSFAAIIAVGFVMWFFTIMGAQAFIDSFNEPNNYCPFRVEELPAEIG
jgi:hypothetical protein